MHTIYKNRLIAITAMFLLGLVSMASATVTISSSVQGTPDYQSGTTFTITVEVSDNPTTEVPSHAALRITYDTADVSFDSADGDSINGWLGDVNASAIGDEMLTTGTLAYRDIPTLGNFLNTDIEPTIMDVTFQVIAGSPDYPIDLQVELVPGPGGTSNSFINTLAVPIPVSTIDNSSLTSLGPAASVDDWSILEAR